MNLVSLSENVKCCFCNNLKAQPDLQCAGLLIIFVATVKVNLPPIAIASNPIPLLGFLLPEACSHTRHAQNPTMQKYNNFTPISCFICADIDSVRGFLGDFQNSWTFGACLANLHGAERSCDQADMKLCFDWSEACLPVTWPVCHAGNLSSMILDNCNAAKKLNENFSDLVIHSSKECFKFPL